MTRGDGHRIVAAAAFCLLTLAAAAEIYDIQSGARTGSASLLMQPVVAQLTADDMIAIAAYVASLAP